MTAPLPDDAPFAELLEAWVTTTADFVDLAASLTQEEWDTATLLPGWTVGDVIAHVSWIEGLLAGRMDAPHEPDWSRLPHVRNDFGRATEVPVDLRRGWPRDRVVAELIEVTSKRSDDLRSGPQDGSVEVVGPLGPAPLGRVVRMRTMDTWVHEQDIREAIGRPDHLDSAGARATAAQLLPGLPKVWVKGAGAAAGDVLRVIITGPELVAEICVAVDDTGRGRLVECVDDATVTLSMPWTTYLALAGGRGDLVDRRAEVVIEGDPSLAARTLDAFTIMI